MFKLFCAGARPLWYNLHMAGTGISSFESDAVTVMRRLRRATAGVLGAVPGLSRAVDVADRLGLDRSLAWKIWRVAQGESEIPSPAHVPGRSGFIRFLDGAGVAGADAALVVEAKTAFEQFERLTAEHAGDRASADIMLAPLSDEGRRRQELARRRDAFRANSHFLGVQCRTLFQADVLLPSGPAYMPDVGRLRAHFGLRRMRPNVPWIVARSTLVNDQGPKGAYRREPLTPTSTGASFLVPQFSSTPSPQVSRRVIEGYTVEDELAPGPVGEAAATDVVLAERVSMMTREAVESDAVTMPVFTPAERLVYDVLIHESAGVGVPVLRVNSTVHGDAPYLRGRDYDLIPVPESFTDLGTAAEAPAVAEVPRYAAMMAWFIDRLGVSPDALRCYRAKLRFPPLPSRVAAHYDLS